MQKKHIVLQSLQHRQKPSIILRHHNTESYKFPVQALEGRTVTDHHALSDAGFKYVIGGQSVFQDPEQDKVCIGGIDFVGVCIPQFPDHPVAFGKDQISGFFNIIFILQHDLSCKGTKAVK